MSLPDLRSDFPILAQRFHNQPLIYLDNAATTQKPQSVIDAIQNYYESQNANIHRGVYALSERATVAFEQARTTVQHFINASDPKECLFVKSTTEAINLVAYSFGERYVQPGDEILISAMEHHANIVPWQMMCERKGAKLIVIPMNQQGELELKDWEKLLTPKTKLLAITHVSNAIGTINPIEKLIKTAHQAKVPVLVDAAQSVPHFKVDVQALDCDFLTFSGHKTYGPTGIGVLYGKTKWLEELPPYQGGGDMIRQVSFSKTTFNDLPYKFEAGTPPIAQAIGLAAALNYLNELGWDNILEHEKQLLRQATEALKTLPHCRIIGQASQKVGVISFVLENIHPHDIGSVVDQYGVALRAGHHCAMPLMEYFGVPATARISFGIYNTVQDIEGLMKALDQVKTIFTPKG